jgi:hypothetical protein
VPARRAKAKHRAIAKKHVAKAIIDRFSWLGPRASPDNLQAFGLRLAGGGAHQSKTMMLAELQALLSSSPTIPEALRLAVVVENVLGKSTANTRVLTYRHLASLYGLSKQPPLTRVLLSLWRSYPAAHPLLALLVALSRDPLLRDTARVIIDAPIGVALQWPSFEAALVERHPHRFSASTLRSLARNCASTWTQSGHLRGPVRKLRQRITPAPEVVALAALVASVAGFGGPAILDSPWIRVLDLTPDQALDDLRRAQRLGLARVRSTGDFTEIATRKQIAATLRMPELELTR